MIDLDAMVAGYLECQLWAQLDMGNPSCDCHSSDPQNACHNYCLDESYDVDDVSDDYRSSVRAELESIVETWRDDVQAYHDVTDSEARLQWSRSELFGHDFYLTREGHGTGFWDRGLGELGDRLTDVAKSYGSADMLYGNDNGKLVAE